MPDKFQEQMSLTRWSKVAENVVDQSLRIRDDDVVGITSSRHMLDLADEIAMRCRLAGAETTTLFWSEPVWYWSLEKLPTEWLRAPNKVDGALLDVLTATISINGAADPAPLTRIPAERWTANAEGADHWYRKYLERKPRSATLNTALVTPERARAYGLPFSDWEHSISKALETDLANMRAAGKRIEAFFDQSQRQIRITSRNGTDITFRQAGRKCRNDDGMLDDEDLASGNFETHLPAGYLSMAPEEESANGRIVFDLPTPLGGKFVDGIRWEFDNGKVRNFDASRNGDMLLELWRKATGDKDRMGLFGIGFNHDAVTGFFNDNIAAGVVTFGIGDNRALGGKNESSFAFQGSLGRSTVVVDDQPIVSNGTLLI
jgi:leucyl aminopeptidase (aminopeptidase T)